MASHPPHETAIPAGATVARRTIHRWGDRTRLVPSAAVAVTTVVTRVVKNNPRRVWLFVFNSGVTDVFVDWNAGVTSGNGLILSAHSGSVELLMDEDGELITEELFAVNVGTVAGQLSVWEQETL